MNSGIDARATGYQCEQEAMAGVILDATARLQEG